MKRWLTILFGALPASFLCFFAAMALSYGLGALFGRNSYEGLILTIWGAAGIYGTGALWVVAFRKPGRRVLAGLIVGIAAMVPLVLSVNPLELFFRDRLEFLMILAGYSPIVVATYWLVDAFFGLPRRRTNRPWAHTARDE